jgi:N-acetyl-alpha-D-glucosaminyl L-malate synthase BshA
VNTPAYPLFREPQYLLSLATKIVQLSREFKLDVVHAHYAVPHATAGYLAKQILTSTHDAVAPQVITTLHGTDITLIGGDPSYAETVAFSIDGSDGVTAVSESLKTDTYRTLGVKSDIRVIPNFLDCDVYKRLDCDDLRDRFTASGRYDFIISHVSNFRPVKRVAAVVDIFKRVLDLGLRAKLLLIGDGPDLPDALRRAREHGIAAHVESLGEQDAVLPLLSISDAFLLPSAQESFGLAALEAMACRVPVVASRVGGLPEVIDHGVTGFLHDPDDLEGMASSVARLFRDADLLASVGTAARETVRLRFCVDRIVPRYESYYAEVGAHRTGVKTFG